MPIVLFRLARRAAALATLVAAAGCAGFLSGTTRRMSSATAADALYAELKPKLDGFANPFAGDDLWR